MVKKPCLYLCMFFLASHVCAKAIEATLAQLIEHSDVVVYVEIDKDKNRNNIEGVVIGEVIEEIGSNFDDKLKGNIPICNESQDSESYDFKDWSGQVIFFLKKSETCYEPVWRLRSTIIVEKDGMAKTVPIKGLPNHMEAGEFIRKIQDLFDALSQDE